MPTTEEVEARMREFREAREVYGRERLLRDVFCPQCGWWFELVWNGATIKDDTLRIRSCPSGGIYDVTIACPECDYEEPL